MKVDGIVWMGVRSEAHRALCELFGAVMGMEMTRDGDGFSWFALPNGEEIQVYAADDADHAFFGTAPVVGFRVADFDVAVAEMSAAGVEWVGDGDRDEQQRWRHFRGPDGNVYEILGP